MKPRTTLILLAVFVVLLGAVLLLDTLGKKKKEAGERANELIDLKADDIRQLSLVRKDGTLTLEKDDQGSWLIKSPLEAAADDGEARRLAESFSPLRIERVIEKEGADPKAYEIPTSEVLVWTKGQEAPVRLLIGMENPLDRTVFAQKEGDPRIVLLSSSFKSSLEKTVFDLRRKDIFKFSTADVKTIRLRAKDVAWEAAREEPGWFLKVPVEALAVRYKLDGLLDSLSALRAKEFVAETKTPETLKAFGLDKPEYEVRLSLPASNAEIVFLLHKTGEAQYATTSQSTKIVSFEGTLLGDLDRKVDELREKKVADINSWEAERIVVKRGALELALVKDKTDAGEAWLFEGPEKEKADRTKVDDLIRKVEALEAVSFIDKPGPLESYGLDGSTEVRIRTKNYQDKVKETVLLIGREDPDAHQVVVKNSALAYLFRVDSGFLQSLPAEKKDWLPEPPKTEKDKDAPEKK